MLWRGRATECSPFGDKTNCWICNREFPYSLDALNYRGRAVRSSAKDNDVFDGHIAGSSCSNRCGIACVAQWKWHLYWRLVSRYATNPTCPMTILKSGGMSEGVANEQIKFVEKYQLTRSLFNQTISPQCATSFRSSGSQKVAEDSMSRNDLRAGSLVFHAALGILPSLHPETPLGYVQGHADVWQRKPDSYCNPGHRAPTQCSCSNLRTGLRRD